MAGQTDSDLRRFRPPGRKTWSARKMYHDPDSPGVAAAPVKPHNWRTRAAPSRGVRFSAGGTVRLDSGHFRKRLAMFRMSLSALFLTASLAAYCFGDEPPAAASPTASPDQSVARFLEANCLACHDKE